LGIIGAFGELHLECTKGGGSIPGVVGYWVWNGGQWRDSVNSARTEPALNSYLGKTGESKQEDCAKAQVGWSPTPIPLPG